MKTHLPLVPLTESRDRPSVKRRQVCPGHREFGGDEHGGVVVTDGTPDDAPVSIARSLHRDVGLAVAVLIAGHRPVAAQAPRVIVG